MNWFWIALVAPIVWAASVHVDKYLLNRYVQKNNFGVLIIATSFVGVIALLLIGILVPGIADLAIKNILVLLLAGFLFVLYLFPYFNALNQGESTLVIPLFQTVPVFSYVLALIFLQEILTPFQILGALIIIFSAVGLSINFREKIRFNKSIFWSMMLSAVLVSIGALLFKSVALQEGFWVSMFWQVLSSAVTGFSLFFFSKFRQEFFRIVKQGGVKFLSIGMFSESLGIIGDLSISFATLLAPIALVQVVNGAQPFFIFLFGVLLTWFFPKVAKEDLSRKILMQKILFIAIMFAGTYLISVSN
jgi:uncharacterized membrane protein